MNTKDFNIANLQVFEGFFVEKAQVLKLGADLIVVKRFDPRFGSRK